MTSAFSKSSVFAVQTNMASVLKFIHSGERFQKVPFSVTVLASLVWTEGQSGEKNVAECG